MKGLILFLICFNSFISFSQSKACDAIDLKNKIESYEKSIANDSLNYKAYKSIGLIYHCLGINLILNHLECDDSNIESIILTQEKSIIYFNQAITYLNKAYLINPKNEKTIQGLAAVYLSLNDDKKYNIYKNILN